MALVTVPALASFTHQGQSYRRGDTVSVSAVEAAALARQGYVSIESGYQVRALETEAPVRATRRRAAPAGDRPKRQYRRRDLVAGS